MSGVRDSTLADGRVIRARSIIVTSGAAYRRLNLDRWPDFERSGIYYAATQLELRQVMQSPVVVVGGANSAGQASLYLAANGCPVHLASSAPSTSPPGVLQAAVPAIRVPMTSPARARRVRWC